MKTPIVALLLGIVVMAAGCATSPRGAAYGREQELRHQLAESVPMKEYGYTIKDLRFSADYKKALVVFTHRDSEERGVRRRPDGEFVLTEDEFGRYRGMSMQPFYTPGTSLTPPIDVTATFSSK